MKTILITGSSRGIGEATARIFAKHGWNIVLNYNHSEQKAITLANDLGKYANVLCVKADVGNNAELNDLYRLAREKFGKIDAVVNNAGVTVEKMLVDMTFGEIRSVVDTNLVGTINSCRLALNQFDGEGTIVNISSCQGEIGASCEAVYASTKAGISCLSRSLIDEYADTSVRIFDLPLGWVDTDMTARYTKSEKQEFLSANPQFKAQTKTQVAKTIYDLITK